MASAYSAVAAVVADDLPRRASRLSIVWGFCRRNPLGAFGALVGIVMMVMAAAAELMTSYDPTANDFGAMLSAPVSSRPPSGRRSG